MKRRQNVPVSITFCSTETPCTVRYGAVLYLQDATQQAPFRIKRAAALHRGAPIGLEHTQRMAALESAGPDHKAPGGE